MKWIRRLGHWLAGLWPWRRRPYRAEVVEDFPEHLRARLVYIAGEGGHAWAAAMVCPCGCRDIIHLNLLPDVSPRWQLVMHDDGSVTLHPSVWRQKGCRSHFFVRAGSIAWCGAHDQKPPTRK
jgi:hypothetical protein